MPRGALFFLITFAVSLGLLFVFVRLTHKPEDPEIPESTPSCAPSADMVALYVAQAPDRRKMIASTLRMGNVAGVPDVFLPLVPEVFCPGLVRIGALGDGGKWMCAPWMAAEGCVVYSLGSNNDISFEEAFQAAVGGRCFVRTVDMGAPREETLRGLEAIHGKYRQAYITTHTDKDKGHYLIHDLMEEEGHDEMEVLKIDIEGAEHAVLPLFLSAVNICQILVEIHGVQKTMSLLNVLGRFGYLLMHYELNAYWAGTGLSEFSFIHKNCTERYGAQLLAQYLA